MSAKDKLERVYHNMRPEYHPYFRTLPEMLCMAIEYEHARQYERTYQPPTREGRLKEKPRRPTPPH